MGTSCKIIVYYLKVKIEGSGEAGHIYAIDRESKTTSLSEALYLCS
jgi:hypothetical protein